MRCTDLAHFSGFTDSSVRKTKVQLRSHLFFGGSDLLATVQNQHAKAPRTLRQVAPSVTVVELCALRKLDQVLAAPPAAPHRESSPCAATPIPSWSMTVE